MQTFPEENNFFEKKTDETIDVEDESFFEMPKNGSGKPLLSNEDESSASEQKMSTLKALFSAGGRTRPRSHRRVSFAVSDHERPEGCWMVVFKAYVIVSMILLWTGYTILVSYSRWQQQQRQQAVGAENDDNAEHRLTTRTDFAAKNATLQATAHSLRTTTASTRQQSLSTNAPPPTTLNNNNNNDDSLIVANAAEKQQPSSLTTTTNDGDYFSTTVVFLAECVKLVLAVLLLYVENGARYRRFLGVLRRELFGRPIELLKMSVPSMAYALQNNLDFVALSNLSPSVYQVTIQLKIPSTALFMMLIIGRRFSLRRWMAIALLCAGVAAVQLENLGSKSVSHAHAPHPSTAASATKTNPMMGLTAVLVTCLTAGFAGAFFEYMLKDGSDTSLWVRNIQMYLSGVAASLLACYTKDGDGIREHGLTHGYSPVVWVIIALLSLGGIYISLVMRYLDNVHKAFASAATIILVVMATVWFPFDDEPLTFGIVFLLGASTVIAAAIIYNSTNE